MNRPHVFPAMRRLIPFELIAGGALVCYGVSNRNDWALLVAVLLVILPAYWDGMRIARSKP
jgi:hypothetical protein